MTLYITPSGRLYHAGIGRFLKRDPLRPSEDPNPYCYAHNNPVTAVDPAGEALIYIVAGGAVLLIGAAIYQIDFGTDSLSSDQAKDVQRLIDAIKNAARKKWICFGLGRELITSDKVIKNLDGTTITGIFERGKIRGDDVSETRNGRLFGYGNRTILRADFFDVTDEEGRKNRYRTLIHESWHAGREDWTEDYSSDYAENVIERLWDQLRGQ